MRTKLLLVGFGLFFFSGTAVFAELDPLEIYDNLNAKNYEGCKFCINPEKWIGFERGDYNTEVLREIKAKRLHMTQRTWGMMDSNAGTTQGRNRMTFRDSVNFSGACFTPRIKKYELNNCAANPDHGHTRIRLVGNFYDTGVADDADVGVVYGWIELLRHGDTGDKKGVFGIHGYADECLDANCTMDNWSTYDGNADPDLYFGNVKASKNKKSLCIGYDRANHQLVFSYGNDVRTVNTVDHGLPTFANNLAANQTWYVIDTRNDVENCAAKKLTGYIDADVDDVKVRRFVKYEIGDTGPAGGIVFYVTNGGTNGLEAAPVDQAIPGNPGAVWGCAGTDLTGAEEEAIGTGAQNTMDILAGCSTAGIAARLADNYSLNGYDDWFLPSFNEQMELHLNELVVGGFSNGLYWSSSEAGDGFAACHQFGGTFSGNCNKALLNGVRAVRAF